MSTTQVPTQKPQQGDLTSLNTGGSGNFMPSFKTFDDVYRFCTLIASSDMVPKAYKSKPADVMVAVQFGAEVGLKWMQSLQSIATINGIPSIYGDAALALVRASNKLEEFDEWIEVNGERMTGSFPIMTWADDPTKIIIAKCRSKRIGDKEVRLTWFSVDDAKRANLWGKSGPWTGVPQRMLMWRARGWNLRDNFGDVLKGLAIYEEAIDIEQPTTATVTAEIAAKSQPETKGVEIAKALDAVVEQRQVEIVQQPVQAQAEKQPEQAQEQVKGEDPMIAQAQADEMVQKVKEAIATAESVLCATDAGKKAFYQLLGTMKVKLTGKQKPVDAIPVEQHAFYLRQLSSAVDALEAGK